MNILAGEGARLYGGRTKNPKVKRFERSKTIDIWRARRNSNTDKAAWTNKLIPNITHWFDSNFKVRTYRNGKTPDSYCLYCNEEDKVEYTFFECNRRSR